MAGGDIVGKGSIVAVMDPRLRGDDAERREIL
jgi:hypothetical protein